MILHLFDTNLHVDSTIVTTPRKLKYSLYVFVNPRTRFFFPSIVWFCRLVHICVTQRRAPRPLCGLSACLISVILRWPVYLFMLFGVSRVSSTDTLHNFLSKPLASFPPNHRGNNDQQWKRNESCCNDYHQCSERSWLSQGSNQWAPAFSSYTLPKN